jgi:phosphatidylinositol alpha-1,6-mannosyltransferase
VTRVLTPRNDLMALTALPAAVRVARALRPDVVLHGQWWTAPIGLALQRSGLTRAVATWVHGRDLLLRPWARSRIAQLAYDRARAHVVRAVDRVLANSAFTAAVARDLGVASERITVVPLGVDGTRFAGGLRERGRRWLATQAVARGTDPPEASALAQEGTPIVLSVARLVRRKGIDALLEAWVKVRDAVPTAHLVVGGHGPDGGLLRARADVLGIARAVTWLGRVPDEWLPDLYAAADVFALPARNEGADVEGFGLVFLEAGAAGLPVVAGREGGVPDAVLDGRTGVLVDPRDPADIAGAIVALLHDAPRRRSMGDAARARALGEASWLRVATDVCTALAKTVGAAHDS